MKTKFIISIFIFTSIFSCNKSADSALSSPTTTGKAGSMARFAITDNSLYIVDHTSLKVYDIANPKLPSYVGTSDIGIGIETIFPYKNNLFIGSQNGMHIFNVSDRLNPVKLSTYAHIFSCDPVVADDNYAYVTLRSGNVCQRGANRLDIVDITNLEQPTFTTSMDMVNPYGLALNGDNLYVCDNGLKVINVSDKADLQLKKHFKNVDSYDVIYNLNRLMLIGADGLVQYSIANDTIHELSRINAFY